VPSLGMATVPVDLEQKLSSFAEHWAPKVVARLNDYDCPVAAGEVRAVLIEPAGVVNTGDAGGPLTAGYDDSMA